MWVGRRGKVVDGGKAHSANLDDEVGEQKAGASPAATDETPPEADESPLL